jgi:hypothetical protein
MKKLLTAISLVSLSLGFSSCCSMFGLGTSSGGNRTETTQVATGKYEKSTKLFYAYEGAEGIPIESKQPIYKTVTTKTYQPCPRNVRPYCAAKGCGGNTTDAYLKMVTSQGPVGSPSIGLVPTMKKLAE